LIVCQQLNVNLYLSANQYLGAFCGEGHFKHVDWDVLAETRNSLWSICAWSICVSVGDEPVCTLRGRFPRPRVRRALTQESVSLGRTPGDALRFLEARFVRRDRTFGTDPCAQRERFCAG